MSTFIRNGEAPSVTHDYCNSYYDSILFCNFRLTSTLHAFVTSSGCVYVMLTDENIHDDPTW